MSTTMTPGDSLQARLVYQPSPLRFGTSGRRGKVVDLSQLEIYINVVAELRFLQSLSAARGGIRPGDDFYFAYDLRPSSSAFVPEERGRGEIAQAVERGILDAGMRPVNLGRIPTPALAYYAFKACRGSIMVTGSHIPFDRNGYKLNRASGELLKEHEARIDAVVCVTRERVYSEAFSTSLFDENGRFKQGHADLSAEVGDASASYLARYTDFFGGSTLRGMRVVVYQHSAVGRDLLVEVLRRLGAEVIPCGRSDEFVPIDTENVEAAQVALLQGFVDRIVAESGPINALLSTDGDSDRPLLLVPEEDGRRLRLVTGDMLGMMVAEYLRAGSVVVPVTCSDALDLGPLARVTEPKTRIGSPYVIAGMERAKQKGAKAICGWEANGGFLTASDIVREGAVLTPLPTRDALLPLLSVLFAAREKGVALRQLLDGLPKRFSRSGLLKGFPRAAGVRLVAMFSPEDSDIREVAFDATGPSLTVAENRAIAPSPTVARSLHDIHSRLEHQFSGALGFGSIRRINYTDGVRITFTNGDVAHFRPSGNADELRIYAVADTEQRAQEIVDAGTAEPNGILRSLEKLL